MKSFKVCYVSSEITPFAKTSIANGLAATSSALPTALKEMEQDIRLMMPKYKSINDRKYVLREVIRLREVNIQLGDATRVGNGKTAFLPNSKVHVYFLSVPELFDRKGFYVDPQSGEPYEDNAERFGFFCKSVLETLKLLYWQPDIIHCADWSTALIPFYLKTLYKDDEFFENTRTVLTVHNLSQQGVFDKKIAKTIGIDSEHVKSGAALELEGKLNFLKGGLLFSDIINLTSSSLTTNLLANGDPAFGMAEVLKKRKKDIFGIASGADYTTWNPLEDKLLTAQFDAKTLAKRLENKSTLATELRLNDDSKIPLVGVMLNFQIADDVRLVQETLPGLLKDDVQAVVLNTGEFRSITELKDLQKQFPGKLALRERMDKRIAHLLLGSADITFIPSEISAGEQFHLNSMRYGAIPVVQHSGSLADTIHQFSIENGKGNGFCFDSPTAEIALEAIQNALQIRDSAKAWARVQRNAMKTDFSWETTAKDYLKLYEKAQKK